MATRTQNRSTVDMPDAADLIGCCECELDDGAGGRRRPPARSSLRQWEMMGSSGRHSLCRWR